MKILLTGILGFAGVAGLYAAEPVDSVSADSVDAVIHELREVSVEQQRIVRDERGVSHFYPSKRDRKLAASGVDVLRNLGVPDLSVNPMTGEVTNVYGEPVAMFVDSLPADAQMVANLNTADIRRVDLLESPDDPAFNGARWVVNFIMAKYEYGGYTKLSASQTVVSESGKYGAYSKFAYRRMTWDVAAGCDYEKSSHTGSESMSRYDFGNETVERVSDDRAMDFSRRTPYVTLRGVYQGQNVLLSNSLGFKFNDVPRSDRAGVTGLTGASALREFDSDLSHDTRSFDWNGQYNFAFAQKWLLALAPQVSYDKTHRNSSYLLEGDNPIVNDVGEQVVSAALDAQITRRMGQNSLSAAVKGSYVGDDIDYAGTTVASTDIRNYFANVRVSGSFSFSRGWLFPQVGLNYVDNNQAGYSFRKLLPMVYVSGGYSLSRKSSLSGSLYSEVLAGGVTDHSDTRIYINEIEAVEGNKYLQTRNSYTAAAQYNLQPLSNLQLSAMAKYNYRHRPVVHVWTPSTDGADPVMVRSAVNDGSCTRTEVELNATAYLFKNRLMLNGSGGFTHWHNSGIYHNVLNVPRYTAQAWYMAGNFQFGAYIRHNFKSLNGPTVTKFKPYYQLTAAWGNGAWYVSFNAANLFRSSCAATSAVVEAPLYGASTQFYSPSARRYFNLSVVYTFGYGKKVSRGDEAQGIGSQESGILK